MLELASSAAVSELEGQAEGGDPATDISTSNSSSMRLFFAIPAAGPVFFFHGGTSPDADRFLVPPALLVDAFFPRFHGGREDFATSPAVSMRGDVEDASFALSSIALRVGVVRVSPSLPAPVSSSSPPFGLPNRPLLLDLDDTPRSSARSSASSAEPPRSPVKDWSVLNPPPSSLSSRPFSATAADAGSGSSVIPPAMDTALSSASSASSCASPLCTSPFPLSPPASHLIAPLFAALGRKAPSSNGSSSPPSPSL
mmetsp:Transcript_15061/g.43549  ORF Transcript_15061/g.43549 Transcript_15061/m.43549 type:complete len:255 (+) Transcript_15061:3308-4072(+)